MPLFNSLMYAAFPSLIAQAYRSIYKVIPKYFGGAAENRRGFEQVQPVEPTGPANLVKTRLRGHLACSACGPQGIYRGQIEGMIGFAEGVNLKSRKNAAPRSQHQTHFIVT